MTHTAEPMTLDQLRDELAGTEKALRVIANWKIEDFKCAKELASTTADSVLNVLSALAAELAKQREVEPVAFVPVHPKNGPLWANTTAMPNSENVPQHYPLMPLYTHSQQRNAVEDLLHVKYVLIDESGSEHLLKLGGHVHNKDGLELMFEFAQQRNAVEVTDDLARLALHAYDDQSMQLNDARYVCMRAALEAVLSAVASRDREDAGYYKWRLDEIIPLFEEARDALPAISEASRKLHGIDPLLANRMDKAGYRTREEYLAARRENRP